ncbi:MAG: CbtB-domain containing protein [Rhodospirillales bacterium]|nr:CbtB-domain containing protein [Rhodospirillales bacterium]
MTTQTTQLNQAQSSTRISSRLAPAFFALLFGVFLVFGAGFANSSVLHNATHDVRHANGFPCH